MTILALASSRPTAAPAAAAATRRRGGARCHRAAPPPAALFRFRGRLTPSLGQIKSNNDHSDDGNGNHLGSARPGNAARPRVPAPAPATRGARGRPRARAIGGGGGDERDTQPKPSEGKKHMKNDDMSDDEALGIIEKTLQARMSPKAARAISQGFLDIDAPAGRQLLSQFASCPVCLCTSQLHSQPFCLVPGNISSLKLPSCPN